MTFRALPTALLSSALLASALYAQDASKKSILVDVGHGEKFWADPAHMEGRPQDQIGRARYLGGELGKTAASVGAGFAYATAPLTAKGLAGHDALFIHVPTKPFARDEVEAIGRFVAKGGSLLVVMEEDYWSKMEDTNVNDLVGPYGIAYDGPMAGEKSGGCTKAGIIAPEALKIPYHGGRTVTGGTPFCFTQQAKELPFGVFVDVENGGKVVAMGDGMVALYMNSWDGVNDYQCAAFMHDVFAWLLE